MRLWSFQGMGAKLLALCAPISAPCGGVYVHKRPEEQLEQHLAWHHAQAWHHALLPPESHPFNPPTARGPTGRLERNRSFCKQGEAGRVSQPGMKEGQPGERDGQLGQRDSQLEGEEQPDREAAGQRKEPWPMPINRRDLGES